MSDAWQAEDEAMRRINESAALTWPKAAQSQQPLCSHCRFPLPESDSGLRHYGTHTAHQENECLRLLHAEIARLNAWADGMTDAALKERATGELYQRELRELADREGSRAVEYLRRARRAEAALRELVALKDMKDRLRQLHEMGYGTDYGDYHRRQPLAWAEARQVLGMTPNVELTGAAQLHREASSDRRERG